MNDVIRIFTTCSRLKRSSECSSQATLQRLFSTTYVHIFQLCFSIVISSKRSKNRAPCSSRFIATLFCLVHPLSFFRVLLPPPLTSPCRRPLAPMSLERSNFVISGYVRQPRQTFPTLCAASFARVKFGVIGDAGVASRRRRRRCRPRSLDGLSV